jgi:hypothetical protein
LSTAAGAAALVTGAVALDAGRLLDHDGLARAGFALTAVSALGLVLLPAALGPRIARRSARWFRVGAILYVAGVITASLIDVPSILDPENTSLGETLGLPALVLVSIGLLVMRRSSAPAPALRRLLLLAGLWLFIQLPVNVALVVVPTGEPSFILLAGGIGILLAAVGLRCARTD